MVILDALSAECPEHEECPEVLPWKFGTDYLPTMWGMETWGPADFNCPLVNIQQTMENHHVSWENPL